MEPTDGGRDTLPVRVLRSLARLTRGRFVVVLRRRYLVGSPSAVARVEPSVSAVFGVAGYERLDEYRALGQDTAARIDQCVARGDRLLIAETDGTIRSFAWLHFPSRRDARSRTRTAHVYKCFTAPESRGLGLYPATLTFALHWLAETGVSEVTIDVDEDNVASIRGIEKAGFELLGRFWFVRLWPRELLIMPAALREYGPSV